MNRHGFFELVLGLFMTIAAALLRASLAGIGDFCGPRFAHAFTLERFVFIPVLNMTAVRFAGHGDLLHQWT
jgi:hypothetical protein